MDATQLQDAPTTCESALLGARPIEPGLGLAEDELLTLRLLRITWEADGVISFEFVDPAGGDLPAFTPGAHIDVHLPAGLVRQYSLCGDPANRKLYRIGVREIENGRASRKMHRELRPGDLVRIGAPRNTFPFAPAANYIFVAGGIGVTPILPMLREAERRGAAWTLFYCSRRTQAAYLDEIRSLAGETFLHASEAGNRLDVARLATRAPDTVLYCCGPERLMRDVEQSCAAWPEGTVRFEWFQPRTRTSDEPDGSFEVVCEPSGRSVVVRKDKSVLQALLEAGISVAYSCEQGVCGTCELKVIEGEVDHRDSILSAAEQARNSSMMACVSRAKGCRLVLAV